MERAFGWGFGKYGQLGNGKLSNFETPQVLKLPPSVSPKQIAAGAHFTLVLGEKLCSKSKIETSSTTADGDGDCLFACGWGKYGRLGTGSVEDKHLPTEVQIPVDKDRPITIISAGHWHAGCLLKDGTIYLWGYNASGLLGVTDTAVPGGASSKTHANFVPSPTLLPSVVKFKWLSCGYNYTYAVSTEGKVYSWGTGRCGVLGHGDNHDRTEPHLLEAVRDENFIKVSCGYSHAALITDKLELYTVGTGDCGALGLGKNKISRNTPAQVYFKEETVGEKEERVGVRESQSVGVRVRVRDVSCSLGEHHPHTLCCTTEGGVWSWGDGYKGKLGHGTQESCDTPRAIDTVHFLNQTVCKVRRIPLICIVSDCLCSYILDTLS